MTIYKMRSKSTKRSDENSSTDGSNVETAEGSTSTSAQVQSPAVTHTSIPGIQETNAQDSLEKLAANYRRRKEINSEIFMQIRKVFATNHRELVDAGQLIDDTAKELERLKLEINKLKKDLHDSDSRFQDLTAQNDKLRSVRDNFASERKLVDKVVGLRGELELLRKQLEKESMVDNKFKIEEANLTFQTCRHEDEVAQIRAQLSEEIQKKHERKLQKNIQELQTYHAAQLRSNKEELDGLRKKNSDLLAQLKNLQSSSQTKDEELENWLIRCNALTKQILTMETGRNSLRTEIARLKREKSELMSSCQNLRDNKLSLDDAIATHERLLERENKKIRSPKRTLARDETHAGDRKDSPLETKHAKQRKVVEGYASTMSRPYDEIVLDDSEDENHEDKKGKESSPEKFVNISRDKDAGSGDSSLPKIEKHFTEVPMSSNRSSGESIKITLAVKKDTEVEILFNQEKAKEFESNAIAEAGGKIYKYEKGDCVFAKVRGYPPWPAQVQERVAGKEEKYFLVFYGTHDEAQVKPQHMFPYTLENINKYGKPGKPSPTFKNAMDEIESGLELYSRGSQDELKYIDIYKEPLGKFIRLHNISDKEVSISRVLQIIRQTGDIRTHYKFHHVKVPARATTTLLISNATAVVHERSQNNVILEGPKLVNC